jgi:hypothetical protein
MGMHHGIIAAWCGWPELRRALEGQAGTLREEGGLPQSRWHSLPTGDAVLHVASRGGMCCALDSLFVLSYDSDLIVTLSRELSCLVVGAGAETVSGTFWFTAAAEGRLRRLYQDVKTTVTAPFELGPPLPTEQEAPLDHADGKGIISGLAASGFDMDLVAHGTPGFLRVEWPMERFPPKGELRAQEDEHFATHQRSDAGHSMNNLGIVARDGGFDMRAW